MSGSACWRKLNHCDPMRSSDPRIYLLHIRDCREVPWREMNDLRNVLIHQYEGADPSLVWAIVERDIPPLLAVVRSLLAS